MTIFHRQKGFTLIELMVVVAIIGILTAMISANLFQAKAKSRDAKRVSDLAQLQVALELFFDRCSEYPDKSVIAADFGMPSLTDSCASGTGTVTLGSFISQIPTSPSPGNYEYWLATPANNDYILKATLETNSVALNDSYKTSNISINCNIAFYYYCVAPK